MTNDRTPDEVPTRSYRILKCDCRGLIYIVLALQIVQVFVDLGNFVIQLVGGGYVR